MCFLKNNKPIYHINNLFTKKSTEPEINSAFDKAVGESEKTKKFVEYKKQIQDKKREVIEDIVEERAKLLKEKDLKEKKELEVILIRIIKDSLKFTKENSPLIAMMPNKINIAINEIKEKRNIGSTKSLNNLSAGNSFNLSMISNNSQNSQVKYESNAFLKALGLDLQNLQPNNIKINIDEAYKFIKKWKVNRTDIKEIIRMKVVNEIMNVEERRSVQKLKKLNIKFNKYMEHKNNRESEAYLNNNQITEKSEDYNSIEKNKTTENSKDNRQVEINKNISNNILIVKNLNSSPQEKNSINIKNNNSSIFIGKSTNFSNIKNTENNSTNFDSNILKSNYSTLNKNNFSNTQNINESNEKNCNLNLNKNSFNLRSESLKKEFKYDYDSFSPSKSKSKSKSKSANKGKLDYKLRPKPEIPMKKKRKLVLNSYKNIDRIMKIINNSENLKSNQNLCKHFNNIRYNKKIDDLTNKLLNMNKLSVQNGEEIDI